MSLHRYAPKRDDNEPEIRARFARHGWHTEALSGTGLPDLMTWPKIRPPYGAHRIEMLFVDVKDRTGKPTPAQVEKWKALAEKGIPVYVARSEADVDAIVAGTAEPWRPAPSRGALAEARADASGPLRGVREPGNGSIHAPRPAVYRRRKP